MAKPLSLAAARAAVVDAVRQPPAVETVELASAHGRVLAAAVVAAEAWPATDRAAMDGFALAAGAAGVAAGTRLPVVGASLAGQPFAGALPPGASIRIMTGAVVPPGADAVVPVEQTSGFGGEVVEVRAAVRSGANVRPRGSELAAGTVVLPVGRRLRAADVGVLAVLGRTTVPVAARPVVAIVATGDEVVPVDRVPLPHQVRESNSWAAAAQVAECGGVPLRLGIAPDEPAALRAMLQRGLEAGDVLVTIGGVSQGSHDLVHPTLLALGVQPVFHGIDLKPGKPTFFGVAVVGGRTRHVFGLPGNPASSFTVFDLLVRPLLRRWLGEPTEECSATAPAAGAPWRPNARLQAIPARLVPGPDGELLAALAPSSPSGDPFALAGADAYALVPPQQPSVARLRLGLAGGAGGVALP